MALRTRGFAIVGLIETMGTKTRIQRSFKLVIAYSKFISKSCVTCVYKKDFVSIHSADNTPATVRYHWTLFYQFVCHCLFFCFPLFTHRCLSCFNLVIESLIIDREKCGILENRRSLAICFNLVIESLIVDRQNEVVVHEAINKQFQSRYRESYR